jgi:hypothetical protein
LARKYGGYTGRVAVDLQLTTEACQMANGMFGTATRRVAVEDDWRVAAIR